MMGLASLGVNTEAMIDKRECPSRRERDIQDFHFLEILNVPFTRSVPFTCLGRWRVVACM